ncbi:MAG: hypothetical protein GY884_09570 [Proteobacteria bacterium]|nr:hypothetical protein [Pseudomonadota bacterium]
MGIALLMLALGIGGKLWHEELVALSTTFVDSFGGWGVAFGFFYPDMIPVPGAHEAFSAAGLLGGLPFWAVVAWATLGSVTGGTLGFGLARALRRTERFQRFMTEGRGRYVHTLMQRYGTGALALCALAPVPYSVGCWSCGALDYPLWKFLAVSTLRAPRIAFYLWLIEAGLLAVQ